MWTAPLTAFREPWEGDWTPRLGPRGRGSELCL